MLGRKHSLDYPTGLPKDEANNTAEGVGFMSYNQNERKPLLPLLYLNWRQNSLLSAIQNPGEIKNIKNKSGNAQKK